VWMVVLTALGYFIGDNIQEVKRYTDIFTAVVIASCVVAAAYFIYTNKKKNLAKNRRTIR
jgi:membrane protein DedA with SNARE-associated domain